LDPWHADTGRQLLVDPDGREMLISCGAALFGLRLAVRSLGHRPEVELLAGLAAADLIGPSCTPWPDDG